ncbi:MAG: 2-amino-4-hydroxy-6-hydroxymethyldihydropteridine diphosphokinase [Chthoniobacterales bacterium]
MAEVGIGMGSNLGDRRAQIDAATTQLRLLAKKDIETSYPFRVSEILESQPEDCPQGTPFFLNAVSIFETDLSPLALLDALQAIEIDFGRPKFREKNTPRTLDLDLLYYDNMTLSSPRLKLPHPRMKERLFVLAPLASLDPNRILPDSEISVNKLLNILINNK